MGLTKLAYASYLQFGWEQTTNWGTDTAATHRLLASKIDMRAEEGRIESNALGGGGPVVETIHQGASMGACEVDCEATYLGIDLIWDCLMGTDTWGVKGGVDTGASPPYTHTWASQKEVHNSLTLERRVGSGTGGQQLTGPKLEELTWSGKAEGNEPLNLHLKFLGKAYTAGINVTR